MRRLIFAVPLLLSLAGTFAEADLVCRLKETDYSDDTPRATMATIYLTEHKVRYESGTGEEDTDFIFRAERGVLWSLNHADKLYTEMDRKTIDAFGAKMRSAMQQMESEMAKLPPEQRKAVEEPMKKQGAGSEEAGKESKDELKKTGEKKTISGFSCTRYDFFVDGEKSSEFWVAAPGQRGLTTSDLAPVKEMAQFFEALGSALTNAVGQGGGEFNWTEAWKYEGFPILTREFDDGEVKSEVLVESIAKERIDSAQFEIPAGYQRKKME